MTPAADKPIGFILKRYPRLSETFILNEIRALERLGTHLTLISLLRPEETHYHPTVHEVRSPVHYLPTATPAKILDVAHAQLTSAFAAPLRYGHALGLAFWWAIRTRHPVSVGKQFLRAGCVARITRANRLRHLHAHFANAPATVARLAAVMCGITFSFTTHAKDLYLSPPKAMGRRVRAASFVLTCTQHNVDYLRGFLPAEEHGKVHLVYHGIDLSAFPPTAFGSPPAEQPLILSVGRLVPKKGMEDLIESCRVLRDRGLPFRCAIVGQGPLRNSLEQRVNELELDGQVQFLGAMAHDRLIRLYSKATVFALACHVTEDGDRDGIPNVIVEAMATGLAVASTRVSGIPELVDDGKNGLLVAPRDTQALADAIEHLIKHPDLRHRIGQAARSLIEDQFECWETAKEVRALLLTEALA